MSNLWHAKSNSGDVVVLERGSELLEIKKPEDPRAQQFFMKLVPGATASDIGVDLLTRPKKPATALEERAADAVARTA